MKNALIIGGTTGIGEAIAEEITHRSAAPFQEKTELHIPELHELDVTRASSIARFFDSDGDALYDQIVYCAGVNHLGMLGELIPERITDSFDVNVIGFIKLLDELIRHQGKEFLLNKLDSHAAPRCSIVAIVSDSAFVPMRGSIAYASSKAALSHAIRCAARELAPSYRINGVAPSTVEDTPMTAKIDGEIPRLRGWTAERARAYEMSLVPMQRRATREEVARLTVDILEGPAFLTGEIVKITGGK